MELHERHVLLRSYDPNSSNSDDIDTSRGELRQYKGGVLKAHTTAIESNMDGWSTATDTQRKRMARSIIRHELGHQFGHGHDSGYLMSGDSPSWFTTEAYWEQYMYDKQACYNPSNGGLFADC